ncbi:MAG: hypothetical protein AB4426_12425 [Xenococcaceae cyanobacterium]
MEVSENGYFVSPDYLLQFLEPRVVTENIQCQGFAPIEGAN